MTWVNVGGVGGGVEGGAEPTQRAAAVFTTHCELHKQVNKQQ